VLASLFFSVTIHHIYNHNSFKIDRGRYSHSMEEREISDLPLQVLRYNPESGEVSLTEYSLTDA